MEPYIPFLLGFSTGMLVVSAITIIVVVPKVRAFLDGQADTTDRALSFAERATLRMAQPLVLGCPGCGSLTMIPCAVPFVATNSQN